MRPAWLSVRYPVDTAATATACACRTSCRTESAERRCTQCGTCTPDILRQRNWLGRLPVSTSSATTILSMTRAKRAAAVAMLNTWKFQKSDTVMIARGRNKGRVATISQVKRDGNTQGDRGRPVPKHKRDRWKTNPKVYLDGKANSVWSD